MKQNENKHKSRTARQRRALGIGLSSLFAIILIATFLVAAQLIAREIMIYIVPVTGTLISMITAFNYFNKSNSWKRSAQSIVVGICAGILSLLVFLIISFNLA